MDNYQKFILEKTLCSISKDMDVKEKKAVANFINENDEFVVQQDENYKIKKHNILISGFSISSVEIDGKKCDKIDTPKLCYLDDKVNLAVVDFDNKANEITLNFANNLAEPLTLKLKFIESDHASFDAKEADGLLVSAPAELVFIQLFILFLSFVNLLSIYSLQSISKIS